MADIAFLLLVFFLVTTTISADQGIRVKLPAWAPDIDQGVINKDNLIEIRMNQGEQILFREKATKIENLAGLISTFIKQHPDPNKILINISAQRSSNYGNYIEVQDQIRIAYMEFWQSEAQRIFSSDYLDLSGSDQKTCRADYPLQISEAIIQDQY
jgi:biopolymer transport protein ExbD